MPPRCRALGCDRRALRDQWLNPARTLRRSAKVAVWAHEAFDRRRESWRVRAGRISVGCRTCRRSSRGVNPVAAAILTAMTGFVLLVAVMGSLGTLLIHVLLPAGVQAWDERAVLWLAERRSNTWSNLSVLGSGMADKLTVVVLASLFLVVLSIRRMWRPAAVWC